MVVSQRPAIIDRLDGQRRVRRRQGSVDSRRAGRTDSAQVQAHGPWSGSTSTTSATGASTPHRTLQRRSLGHSKAAPPARPSLKPNDHSPTIGSKVPTIPSPAITNAGPCTENLGTAKQAK